MSQFARLKRHKKKSIALCVAILLGTGLVVLSRANSVAPVAWGWYGQVNNDAGVAMRGYDPVAYQDGAARLGAPAHTWLWRDSEWHFVSAETRARFEADPQKYAPAYGGFCAFAVSKGFTANADPTVFAVKDGRTYLFDSASVRSDWLADAAAMASGDGNWAKR